jgi:hypothetical protein
LQIFEAGFFGDTVGDFVKRFKIFLGDLTACFFQRVDDLKVTLVVIVNDLQKKGVK